MPILDSLAQAAVN